MFKYESDEVYLIPIWNNYNMLNGIKSVIGAAIDSVKPARLVEQAITLSNYTFQVGGKLYPLKNNIKVIGFGKAALGMCIGAHSVFGSHITTGIASVPCGTISTFMPNIDAGFPISFYEGAKNNLPDDAAFETAKLIKELASNVDENDIVLVLISDEVYLIPIWNNYNMLNGIKSVIGAAIDSVKPARLVEQAITLSNYTFQVGGKLYPLKNNIKVIGFGKAALGMCIGAHSVFGSHITTGIASVPCGTISTFMPNIDAGFPISFYEGAKNNLPDDAAFETAKLIKELASNVDENDIVLVLISGGGSALLPYPLEGLSLGQKQTIIRELSRRGATIHELNTVRKNLSDVKNGHLAKMARKAQIISLIISDIVGSPLDLIASGPTVEPFPSASPKHALSILTRYDILHLVPDAVQQKLSMYN